MDNLISNLKENNLKVTPQRLIIYTYLSQNLIHPNAENIYEGIKKDNPTISLATVYKTLKTLKEAKLIQEINLGEDSFRYDFRVTTHSHIVCTKCKQINDYFPDEKFILSVQNRVKNDTNFELSSHQMYFYGICENCKKKEI